MWTVIEVTLQRESLARAEALLQLAGAAAVTLSDAGNTALLQETPEDAPVWPAVRVAALFGRSIDPMQLSKALSGALGQPVELHERVLKDCDWENAWREHWQPLRFGNRLTVAAAHDKPTCCDDVLVHLTPGLAFGTGAHPTTALCLEWLVSQPLAGKTVVDYGTGSGLLAIAAVKLGARHGYAVDIDPQALTACADNARRNAVRAALTIGAPTELANVTADVVLANILAEPLKALAERLVGLLATPGHLVLSGVLRDQADDVMAAYRPWLEFSPPVERDAWVRLVGRAPGPRQA